MTTLEPPSPISVRAAVLAFAAVGVAAATAVPASADNARLNKSVYANIVQAQKENGCTGRPRLDDRLTELAQRHTLDLLDHPELDGDIGSDGSTSQSRADSTGFPGPMSQTVAINPALAINGVEILNQWWNDPAAHATMMDCANTAIGVWSENSLTRSVVVATYGQPRVQ